jgi:ubiquinone/menaquinone biosynthesis C-methylase UbiE
MQCHCGGVRALPQALAVESAEYALMDAAEDGMWWYRALHARVAQALRACSVPGAAPALLDAGCGTGGLLRRLAAAVPDRPRFGLEYNPAAAARAAAKSGAAVASGDVARLPFPDAGFGAVVSMDVLCHRGVDQDAALAEFRRVLAPGGTLVLNLPAFDWLMSAHDRRVHNARRYTAPQLRALLAASGFTDIRTQYWNAVLLPLMVLQRKVLARREEDASDVAPFPPWLDASLHLATRAEAALARLGLRWPAGGSVLAVATRGPGA